MSDGAKTCPICGLRYDTSAIYCQRDGAALMGEANTLDPRIGMVVLDQFRIEERIGRGGMGTVYRARQLDIGQDVAIKVLHSDLSRNQEAVRRFQREAKVTMSLDHPNLVKVFLFGKLAGENLYLVMEYLKGRTLTDELTKGTMPLQRAIHIGLQLCEGVGYAHEHGIVHRDVKPDNVFLVQRGRDPDAVKVLDFGIARLMEADENAPSTQTGLVFGTARYISPEAALGEKSDPRSDVYSIGVVLYQLVCGVTPFEDESTVALLKKHIETPPRHVRDHDAGKHVPHGIADIIMRTLSKRPNARFANAVELAEVLRTAAFQAGIPLGVRSPSERVSVRAPREQTTDEVPGLSRPRRGSRLIWAGLFLFVLAGVGAIWWSASGGEDPYGQATQALRERRYDDASDQTSVAAITTRLLASNANDERALAIRREAAEALYAQASAASAATDTERARILLARALALSPNQTWQEELAALNAPPLPPPPLFVLSAEPTSPRARRPMILAASATERADIESPQFVIERDGVTVSTQTAVRRQSRWEASLTPAQPGAYWVKFFGRRSGQSGTRELLGEFGFTVLPRIGESDPPVTIVAGAPNQFQPVPTPEVVRPPTRPEVQPARPNVEPTIQPLGPRPPPATDEQPDLPPPWTG